MFDLVLMHILTVSTVDQGAIKTMGLIPCTGAFLSPCVCVGSRQLPQTSSHSPRTCA